MTGGAGAAADDKSFDDGGDDDSANANAAGSGGALSLGRRRQLDAVRSRVSSAALFILEYYAETTGRKFADVLDVRAILFWGGACGHGRGQTEVVCWKVRGSGWGVKPGGGGGVLVVVCVDE